jgi:large subunit ribosomal protein L4
LKIVNYRNDHRSLQFKERKGSTTEIPDGLFGVRFKAVVVKQVLQAQEANARIPWAHAKNRGEVRGGGKKPWRQKGTGRARHGSTRSPLWIGGGSSHGPRNDRDYSQKVNKKMKRTAIAMILSKKLKDGELKFVDALNVSAPKTKILASHLVNFIAHVKRVKKFNMLLIPSVENKAVGRAGRNLPKTKITYPGSLNAYDLMNYGTILVETNAVSAMTKQYE